MGVFLFLGPTGVGKTELATALAQGLAGSDASLIRLDMSEFMEQHSVAKLIGSPPGYVGYEEEGRLTGGLRAKPHSVVLLDEVEKAHPRVLDLFLQLFDEGRLTDSKGREADGRNAVFVMTSNLGSAEAPKRAIGFGEPDAEPARGEESAARGFFRPELLGRVTDKIVFRPLARKDAERVLARLLATLERELLERYEARLELDAEARELLLEKGYSPASGVRGLGRAIDELLRLPLGQLAAAGRLVRGSRIRPEARGSKLEL